MRYTPGVALIKSVTNGKDASTFKAISLTHALPILFALCSVIGAQQTWMWAAAHERTIILDNIRAQIVRDISRHADFENNRLDQTDRRVTTLEIAVVNAQQQININTGRLMKP